MKKIVHGGLIAIVTLCLFGGVVNAKNVYYTNEVGVEMTELEYNKLLKIYSSRYLMNMTQEEFNSLKDVNIISNDAVYYKTVYQNGEVISENQISKEEYDNAPSGKSSSADEIMPLGGDNSSTETSYKKLVASIADVSVGKFQLIASLHWKKVPVIRSFDVFAYRLDYLNYIGFGGSQTYYYETGNQGRVDYDTSSPGYKPLNNGAGVSMNLVDGSTIVGYDLIITTALTKNAPSNIDHGHVYVSYQHSQKDLTREKSMDYYLSNLGHGGVIYFNNSSTASAYDRMGGIVLYPTF